MRGEANGEDSAASNVTPTLHHSFSFRKFEVPFKFEEFFISLQTVQRVDRKESKIKIFGVSHQATSPPLQR
jgi:hypothetical protein